MIRRTRLLSQSALPAVVALGLTLALHAHAEGEVGESKPRAKAKPDESTEGQTKAPGKKSGHLVTRLDGLGPLVGEGWGAEHVIVMTESLSEATLQFSKLGFEIAPPTAVSKVLVHSMIPFRNGTYLELTQFVDGKKGLSTWKKKAVSGHRHFLNRYAKTMRKGGGGASIGVDVSPARQAVSFLRKRGLKVTNPIGDAEDWLDQKSPKPQWWAVDFIETAVPGNVVSFIEYDGNLDMLIRRQNLSASMAFAGEQHPNRALGIRNFMVVVPNLDRATKQYEKVGFSAGKTVELPHLEASGRLFDAGRADILLVRPNKGSKGIAAKHLKKFGPSVLGVSIRVEDAREARRFVALQSRAALGYSPLGYEGIYGRSVWVPSELASGLHLELSE